MVKQEEVSLNGFVLNTEQKMIAPMIRRLPVLDSDDKLAGIITKSDIFRMATREWAKREEEEIFA